MLSTVLVSGGLTSQTHTLDHPIPTPKISGGRETDRQTETERDRDRDSQRQRERETDRERERDRERENCQCSYGDIMNKDNIKLTLRQRPRKTAIPNILQLPFRSKGLHRQSRASTLAQFSTTLHSLEDKKAGRQQ